MLHDIGKIGIKEEILVKEKKLFPYELELISMRLKLMRAQMMLRRHTEGRNYEATMARIDTAWERVVQANDPSASRLFASEVVSDLRSLRVPLDSGEIVAALTHREADRLSISKGNLSAEERMEIEAHVNKTFDILKMIPWSRGLEQVADIAYRHHEKLDGSGYPNQLTAEEIPPQTRMMTICDIFDALTAADRPYKHALPVGSALDLIAANVKAGKLDGDYFDIFIKAQLHELFISRSTVEIRSKRSFSRA